MIEMEIEDYSSNDSVNTFDIEKVDSSFAKSKKAKNISSKVSGSEGLAFDIKHKYNKNKSVVKEDYSSFPQKNRSESSELDGGNNIVDSGENTSLGSPIKDEYDTNASSSTLHREKSPEENITVSGNLTFDSQNNIVSSPAFPNIKKKKIKIVRLTPEEAALRKEERKLAKKKLEEEQNQSRKDKALKGMQFLLSLSTKYTKFFEEKVVTQVKEKTGVLKERNKLQPTISDVKEATKAKPKEEVSDEPREYANLSEHLKYFEGGSLRDYQIEGVTWMTVLFENGLNGILADEMGLGKTVQVIALICHLIERKVPGPYLIVVPLSTIPNWLSEFERFAPKLPVVRFHGSAEERKKQSKLVLKKYDIEGFRTGPIVLTTYQIPMVEPGTFGGKMVWQYIIIDEGHRIKNHNSQLSRMLRSLNSHNRLLLTGTPLQNNITELWSLLNFLLPHIFKNESTFAALFMMEDIQDKDKLLKNEESHSVISTIHKVLAPFMLRRLKLDVLDDMVPKKEQIVYCPLTTLQRDLYEYVINRNIDLLLRRDEEEDIAKIINEPRKKRKCTEQRINYRFAEDEENDDDEQDDSDFEEKLMKHVDDEEELEKERQMRKVKKENKEYICRLTMLNTAVMFKKIVDHPYLVHFPLDPNSKEKQLLINEDLINSSGKLIVLDAMLKRLKEQGHKVLIFSTLVMLIDLVEEFMIMRDYSYARLDGSLNLDERAERIDRFNKDPECFIFLVSTRAGGLGLNLTAADTVIFFDRDWNPQADIQAQDRCHRIGQTRPVCVYTLVTKNTIDEKVIHCGNMKRRLEKLVIKDGTFRLNAEARSAESDLQELKKMLDEEQPNISTFYSQEVLDKLLDRSDMYRAMEEQKAKNKMK